MTCKTAYDRTTRKDDPALAAAARFRSSAAWQKVRAVHVAQHPLCCDPFKVHGPFPAAVEDVHHVEGVAKRPDLALVGDNLRSLCRACHNRVEGLERAGKGTSGLFIDMNTECAAAPGDT